MLSPHEEAVAEMATVLLRPLAYLWSEMRAPSPKTYTILFLLILILRCTRINNPSRIGRSYRPVRPKSRSKRYTQRDVTVILPTTNPESDSFAESIVTILESHPYAVLVVTVQGPLAVQTQRVLEAYRHSYPQTRIGLAATKDASERVRIAHAVRRVATQITVLADDTVSWTRAILPWLLAPFQDDDKVAVVSIEKRLRRIGEGEWSLASAANLLACLCFTKRAHDLREASSGRGADYSLITAFLPFPSGRTTAYRTAFLDDEAIQARLRDTKVPLSGVWGGYGKGKRPREEADDMDIETFLAREAVERRGAKLVFQSTFAPVGDDPVVEVTPAVATLPSLSHLLALDARRTVRAVLAALCSPRLLFQRPKSYILSLLTAFLTLPLAWDLALLWTFSRGTLCRYVDVQSGMGYWSRHRFLALCALMVFVKCFRFSSHFARYPVDLVYLPCHVLFGLVHPVIKIWGLFTFKVDASRRQTSDKLTDKLTDKLNGPAEGFVGDMNSWNFRAVL
ncbi:glycosyltransferase family 2 protein [Sodiomyces alcalophilus JCM 7366]|uniref:glycosyltransferase family 2 protein n=1 Tax=Sodiomyces alcalophilus JCM 7366 TaxID=591952 RepID=UPI0039B3D752